MSLEGCKCFGNDAPCNGILHGVIEDYVGINSNRNRFVAPDVLIFRCDKCKEDLIPSESSRKIEEWRFKGEKQVKKSDSGWKISEIVGKIL